MTCKVRQIAPFAGSRLASAVVSSISPARADRNSSWEMADIGLGSAGRRPMPPRCRYVPSPEARSGLINCFAQGLCQMLDLRHFIAV